MDDPPFLERLKRARAFRVLLLYLGASWFTLQLVATLRELLTLPEWIGPATLILLGVGLVVVIATALVQAKPSTTAAEAAGEVPTDWEVAPAEALESLRRGRLPHLTWGRALVGGVVSISLVIGAAGAYVLVNDRAGSAVGARPVAAEGPATGIAVLPFTVSGPGLESFAEGMVSLVSTNIDGVDGLRSISPRTVMAAWETGGGGEGAIGLDEALQVAARTEARYAVVGDAVSTGPTVRFTAELYDLDTRERLGSGRSEGPTDDVLALIDQMSIDLLRTLVASSGSQTTTGIGRLDGVVTSSVDALRAYLEGEALFRQGRITASLEAYEAAVEADSTFALAWSRIASVHGWSLIDPVAGRDARARAVRFVDRLPERAATLVRAYGDIGSSTPTPGMRAELEQYVRRFPDDPEGWAVLGEYYLHMPGESYARDRLEAALERPVELDPDFAPYYIHLLRYQAGTGDWGFFETMERYRGVVSEEVANGYQHLWDFYHGGDETRAAAEAYYADRPQSVMNVLVEVILATDTTAERNLEMARLPGPGTHEFLPVLERRILASLGRFEAAELPMLDDSPVIGAAPVWRWVTGLLVDEPLAGVSPAAAADSLAAASRRIGEQLESASEDGDPAVTGLEDVAVAEFGTLVTASELLAAGAPDEALEALQALPSRGTFSSTVLGWWAAYHAEALARTGRTREAIAAYEAQLPYFRAVGRLRLGELYEELGEQERARESYSGFLHLFRNADESAQGLVERGRAGLRRVGGSP